MWFDVLFPGFTVMNSFIPLGGTSNHFDVDKIEDFGLWDSFNVTEDIELACNVITKGYKIGYLKSYTNEESVISFRAWLYQRTRWIKGYIVTLITYFRYFNFNRINFIDRLSFNNLCFFVVMNNWLVPFMFVLHIFKYVFNIEFCAFINILNICIFIFMAIFYFLSFICAYFYLNFSLFKSFKVSFLYIFYYMCNFIAFILAIVQLYKNKSYIWNKTEHGICLKE